LENRAFKFNHRYSGVFNKLYFGDPVTVLISPKFFVNLL
jgi:hypothetical protein